MLLWSVNRMNQAHEPSTKYFVLQTPVEQIADIGVMQRPKREFLEVKQPHVYQSNKGSLAVISRRYYKI